MKTKLIVIVLLSYFLAKAQYYPSGNIQINHVQVMFEYPQVKGAEYYKIQIALKSNKPFEKSLICEQKDSTTAHLLKDHIEFGKSYRWKCTAYVGKKAIFVSPEQSFSTFSTHLLRDFKANVTKYDSSKAMPGLMFYDYGIVTDRKGKLILITDSFGVEKRDFMLTHTGSLTYLMRDYAYDRELGGNVIWWSRNFQTHQDKIYGFHHDVTKLKSGNYLVLCKVNDFSTPGFRQKFNEAIVEVDPANNAQWLWKENDHIKDTTGITATHYNSVFLTEDNKVVVSGRDINSILIIDRATGKIEKSIGRKLNGDHETYPQQVFNGQHHVQLLENGNMLLFNNNTAEGSGKTSSILEISVPSKNSKEVERKFFYFFDFPNPKHNMTTKGGGVVKMKNGNYLISSINRNFEITPESEIVWECLPERRDSVSNAWMEMGSYRINYAPDLYPSFFTLEWMYENGKLTGYKIVNKGSVEDFYEVTTKDNRGIAKDPEVIKIAPGKSYRVKIDVLKFGSVFVLPQSNPAKTKELKIVK